MSEIITFPLPTGANYVIPDVGDENWGQNVTNFLVAIPSGVMPTSGTFSLTGDVSFGSTFGLVSQYFKSATVNPASAGFVRLSKTDVFEWRNNANSTNLPLGINGSDQLTFNGTVLTTGSPANLTDAGTDGITITGGTNAVLGSGTSISQHIADASHNGYLSAADWSTFNSKQSALTLPLTVPNGGTGDSSFTAYALLCGGTTSTNPLQSVASVGLSGQFLQSQGAGLLPTWANVAGSGTVNSGTQFQLAYYATSTNAVSGLTLITPVRALVSDANGLPVASSVTTTELNFVSGVTSSIQAQLNGKQISGSYAHTNLDNISGVSADVPMNGHKITGLANGTSASDAAAFGQIPTIAALVAPTVQRFTSGSGTYTRPTSPTPLYIKVKMVGGGGGGSGSGGATIGNGSNGTASTFGSTLSANGGAGGTAVTNVLGGGSGGSGGSATASFGTVSMAVAGGNGTASMSDSSIAANPGGIGGATCLMGGARGGTPTYSAGSSGTTGGAGQTNTGEGGQGANTGTTSSSMKTGSGGGGAGYLEVLVSSPSSSYSYSVGTGGSGGTAGTSGGVGGAGGSGLIVVEEYYQ